MQFKVKRVLIFLLILLCFSTTAVYAGESFPNIKVAVSDMETIITERMINTALSRLGYQMITSAFSENGAETRTNSGEMDLLALQYEGLEQKYNNLVRVPESYRSIEFRAYTRNDHNGVVDSWESLKELKLVGLESNHYIIMRGDEYAADQILVSNYDDLWDALIRNEANVAVIQLSEDCEITLPAGITEAGSVEKKDGYMYLSNKYAELAPSLALELKAMKEDGTMENIRNGSMEDEKDMVLYISSYHGSMKWEAGIDAGIIKALGPAEDYEIYRFNLDARRAINFEAKQFSIAEDIRELLIARQADIVIVSDNDALNFVINNYHKLFEGVPVVFCGINGYSLDMLRGVSPNFVGCTESVSVSAVVEEMLRMYPDTEKIYILNDYTNAGRIWQKDIEAQLKYLSPNVAIEYNENMTKQELMDQLTGLDDHTLILLGTYVTDRKGVFNNEDIMIEELSQVLNVPIFVLMDSYMGSGALGGFVSVGGNQGFTAGSIARQILDGKAISDIPSVYASEALNRWMFDVEALNKFAINKKNLPEGSILLNEKESIWRSWPDEMKVISAVFLFLVLTALIMGFMLYRMAAANKRCREVNHINTLLPLEENPAFHKRAEEIISIVMGKAPLAFFMVIDRIIIEANEFAQKEMGMKLGRTVSDFYKSPSVYERMIRILEQQESLCGDITYFKMREGDYRKFSVNYLWIELNGQKRIAAYAQDVEEVELQKNNLKRSQKDLKIILDALPTAMGIIDSNEKVIEYANDAFMDIFEYLENEQNVRLDLPLIMEQFYACWQGTTVMFEYENEYLRFKNMHLKIYADQIVFLGKQCIALIAQDVAAEIKQAQYLAEAAKKEKEANALKGIFLANMSHEIRTPMNAIIGLSQLALAKEQSMENYDFFSKISSSAKNLLSIINDILDFSKIEAEKMDFMEDVFTLEETIINAFLVATDKVEGKPVEILLDMRPEVPYYLVGDKTRLWQILKNILDNSVKYTNQGRIILSVSLENEDTERVVLNFHIKDTGMGMTEEQTEKLFVPFKQFHRNNSKKAGTGLGMSITKGLIDMMSGEIRVESMVGKGSDFYITIPFKRADNQKTMGDFMRETVGNQYGKIGPILLVSDDEYALTCMSAILKHVNISSVMAQNSAQALELVKGSIEKNVPFTIMIIDYMPGKENLIDLAKQISAISENTKLVLLTTTYAEQLLLEDMQGKVGYSDMIEKPYVVSAFLQKVCNIFPETRSLPIIRNKRYPNTRILICEDNEINQMVVSGILANFDIEPIIAQDGAEALDILEKNTFDLILMDLMMPVMDGYETTKAIRQSNKPYRDIPIVAMTANVMPDDINKCLEEGMNGHLEKPIDLEKFQNVLEEYLAQD